MASSPWPDPDGRRVREAGGVRKAIARTADRLFQQELDADEREIGRRLLLRLTELGDGTADTRRRVALGS